MKLTFYAGEYLYTWEYIRECLEHSNIEEYLKKWLFVTKIFFYFCTKIYCVGAHGNSLTEVIAKSIHKIVLVQK